MAQQQSQVSADICYEAVEVVGVVLQGEIDEFELWVINSLHQNYRVTVVVADLGWVDLKWDVPISCLCSGQLQ